jgi:Holliday junction resolvasome RuvABC endonuclease subunit
MTTKPRAAKPLIKPSPLPIGTRVLGIDASSTAVGLALVESTTKGPRLWEFDLLRPLKLKTAMQRTDYFADAVPKVVADWKADLAAIEWILRAWGPGAQSYVVPLANVQAAIRQSLRSIMPVEEWTSSQWSRNVNKQARAEIMRLRYHAYGMTPKTYDKGLDVADAIGLATWRIER